MIADLQNEQAEIIVDQSVKYLSHAPPHQAYFIDGDHNYETVSQELRLIDVATTGEPCLIFLHDIGWPFAYRDMYYDPETVETPRAWSNGLLSPFSAQVGDQGLPFDMPLADVEGGEENGVLRAVEDFLASSPRNWGFTRMNVLFGFGVLWDQDTASGEAAAALADHARATGHFDQFFTLLELNRLMLLERLHDGSDVWRRQKAYIEMLRERIQTMLDQEWGPPE